jgi:HSP20 family protein
MHRLIKIRIVRDLEHLEERVRRWTDPLLEFTEGAPSFRPAADLYETSQGLVLRLDVAGATADDLSVALAGQELTVRGRRLPPPRPGINRFHCQEMGFGVFERTFVIPISIDRQAVSARYLDGILEVVLPRKIPETRHIPVTETTEGE